MTFASLARSILSTAGISLSVLGAFFSTPVLAQAPPPDRPVISPLESQPEPNGVNITTGKISIDLPSLSVPAAPRLAFSRVQEVMPYLTAKVIGTAGEDLQFSITAHLGRSSSVSFSCNYIDVCRDTKFSGAAIDEIDTEQIYFTISEGSTGAIFKFNKKEFDSGLNSNPRTVRLFASSVTYPDGEVITFDYQTDSLFSETVHRLIKMSSSLGYHVDITYQGASPLPDNAAYLAWRSVNQATLYKSSSPTAALAQISRGANDTITDLAGRVFTCEFCTNAVKASVESSAIRLTLPGDTNPTINASLTVGAYAAPLVTAVVRDGQTWSYVYNNFRTISSSPEGYGYDSVDVTGPDGYAVRYNVAAGIQVTPNRITSFRDALNRTTSYEYGDGKLGKITNPEGDMTQVSYDGEGNITLKKSTPKPGSSLSIITAKLEYDYTQCALGNRNVRCFRPIWSRDVETDPNRQTDYQYNEKGQLTERLEPADQNGVRRKTVTTYSASGLSRPISTRICGVPVSSPATACNSITDIFTEIEYWENTSLPSAVHQRDLASSPVKTLTTTYTYDDAGRVLSVDGPLAGTNDAKYFRYDTLGRKLWEIEPVSAAGVRKARKFTYRASDDKVASVQTGTIQGLEINNLLVASVANTLYDVRRNPIRETLSASGMIEARTDRLFSNLNRLACTAVRMNKTIFGTPGLDQINACTLGAEGTQGPDRITRNTYDLAGQLTVIQKGYGTALQQPYAAYSYTLNGKQQFITDANGNRAQMVWDGFDRPSRWYFPHKSTFGVVSTDDYEEYTYDTTGNRTKLRKRDGRVIDYIYDNLDRVLTKIVPEGCAALQTVQCPAASATRDVYYGYDLRDAPTFARFDSVTGEGVSSVYDAFGRLQTSTTNMGGTDRLLSYAYDDNGRRTKVAHGDLSVPSTISFTYEYNPRGDLLRVRDSSTTVITAFGYDDLGRRTGRYQDQESYQYDGVDRVINHTLAFNKPYDSVATFAYNPAGQIVSKARSNTAYAFTGFVPVDRNYAVNRLNQYGSAGATNFLYDASGNLRQEVTNGQSTDYGYDGENRLVTRTGGVTATYDPLGRLARIVSSTSAARRFVYDGDRLIAEYDDAGNLLKRYVHGNGVDEPIAWFEGSAITTVARRTVLADYQGSIIAVRDGNGNQLAINSYDDYGITKNSANTSLAPYGAFGYTGQVWLPELGMYYYKARIYSPFLGRFLQTDPVGYDDQMNLYAYVGNDPVNNGDPSGLCTGSLIENKDGTCKSTGGFTTGLIGAAQGAIIGKVKQIMSEAADKGATAVNSGAEALKRTPGNVARSVTGPLQRLLSGKGWTRVGRWMHPRERDAMISSGKVQPGPSNLTHVSRPANPDAWRAYPQGSVFVKFNVPTESLRPGGSVGWGIIAHPGSIFDRLDKLRGGDGLDPVPATSIYDFGSH